MRYRELFMAICIVAAIGYVVGLAFRDGGVIGGVAGFVLALAGGYWAGDVVRKRGRRG